MKNTARESIVELPIPPARQHARLPEEHHAPGAVEAPLPKVVIGRLVAWENGHPRVQFPRDGGCSALVVRTGVPLSPADIGCEVILAFIDGAPEQPVVVSRLAESAADRASPSSLDLQVDGERLLVTAGKEIVLRCGEASITLTAAGKVLIKGTYVLSRSSGYNKIKGAAVDIN